MLFRSLYWKIHDAVWRRRMNRYKHKEPYIYYVSKYHEYTHPIDPLHFVSTHVEDTAGDICGEGLCYDFVLDGHWNHCHTFGELLETAYNCDEDFRIPRQFVPQYSEQEIRMLKAVIDASIRHRHLDVKKGPLIIDNPMPETIDYH